MTFLKRPAYLRTIILLAGLLAGIGFGAQASPAAQAQGSGVPIQSIRVEKIVSAKVGETREFWVSLPDGYSESGEKYPVLYMMDGDFNFNSGVIGKGEHVPADSLQLGMSVLFEGWKITQPVKKST